MATIKLSDNTLIDSESLKIKADYSNILHDGNGNNTYTYTATQDCVCYVQITIGGGSASISIDNVDCIHLYGSSVLTTTTVFLKKGQTIRRLHWIKVFGLK